MTNHSRGATTAARAWMQVLLSYKCGCHVRSGVLTRALRCAQPCFLVHALILPPGGESQPSASGKAICPAQRCFRAVLELAAFVRGCRVRVMAVQAPELQGTLVSTPNLRASGRHQAPGVASLDTTSHRQVAVVETSFCCCACVHTRRYGVWAACRVRVAFAGVLLLYRRW